MFDVRRQQKKLALGVLKILGQKKNSRSPFSDNLKKILNLPVWVQYLKYNAYFTYKKEMMANLK